jgi:hypothetical protein
MDELNCLQGGLKDCGTDSNCRKQIEDRIEVVEANMNDYCATCGKTAWPSFIGPSIPPIVIGRI